MRVRLGLAAVLVAAAALAAGCQAILDKAVPKDKDGPARDYMRALAARDWGRAAELSGRATVDEAPHVLAHEAEAVGARVDAIRVVGFTFNTRVSDGASTSQAEVIYAFDGQDGPRAVTVHIEEADGKREIRVEAMPPEVAQVPKYMTWCCVAAGVGLAAVAAVAVAIILYVVHRRRKPAPSDRGPLPPEPPEGRI